MPILSNIKEQIMNDKKNKGNLIIQFEI